MKPACMMFFCALLLTGCEGDGDAAQARSGKGGPAIARDAVWQGNISRCDPQADASPETCLIEQIKVSGGTPAAQTAARYLVANYEPGYVSGWQQKGRVGIANITWPFRANTHSGTLLIPSSGKSIDVDRPPVDLAGNAVWKTFLSVHPDSMLFPPAKMLEAQPTVKGQRLVFTLPIKHCRACDTRALLSIGYNFDADGRATGSEILSINVAR